MEKRCPDHPDRYDCPDALIVYVGKYHEYGLIIHDGGVSSVGIHHCPWCSSSLPPSVRNAWFDAVRALGLDPWNDDLPDEFEDGGWLRDQPGPDRG